MTVEIRRWAEGSHMEGDFRSYTRTEEIPMRESSEGAYVRYDDCLRAIADETRDAYLNACRMMCGHCQAGNVPVTYGDSVVHRYAGGDWVLCDAEAIRLHLLSLTETARESAL